MSVSAWVLRWHVGRSEGYLLEVPYSDDRELLMDILRHGDEVEVVAPGVLRQRIKQILNAAADKY